MQITDTVVLDGTRRTKDNYLIASCRIGRSGCQTYAGSELGVKDKDKVVLWRSPEETFAGDALTSFCFKPVSVGHPKHMIDSASWRDHAVGFTSGDVGVDGDFIRLPMLIADQQAISLIEDGVKELSCGYHADIDMTPGTTPSGERFDGRMTNLRGNHVALVQRGRAGPQCHVSLSDTWSTPEPTSNTTLTTVKEPAMAEAPLRSVMVDGYTIATTDQGAQAIEKLQRQISDMEGAVGKKESKIQSIKDAHAAELNSAISLKDGEIAGLKSLHASALEAKDGELAGLRSTHQAALDALNGEVAALKAKQPDAAQMDAMIADRSNLIDAARKVLGDKFDPKGKSSAEIRREAVSKRLGATAVADKSDDYITAAFDTLTAVGATAPAGRDPVRDSFISNTTNTRTAVTMQDADDAHASYVENLRNGWKSKESV